ncbi:MAG TPA: O-methyltransferase [Bacillales bacterium]|nr:O-methyltransferase [Bacillales bacterium]
MSGASIPYHLRANKAIDRYAFLELLSKIDRYSPISQYKYIGFGGPSLEDFKYIHSRFGLGNMLSIEGDPNVYNRQKFNQPHNCIDCLQQSSSVFIDEFQRTQETIIWLDYMSHKELRNQIEEFRATISKLELLDIIKITVNSHAAAYVQSQEDMKPLELHEARITHLKTVLGENFPAAEVTVDMMTEKRFPEALHLVLKYAANLAMVGQNDIYFQPLTAFSYKDGHQMLTVTGIILERNEKQGFLDKTNIDKWELSNIDSEPPRRINVPDLTIKERLHIDSRLPNSEAKTIQDELGFLFAKEKSISLEMLETYVLFYRQSPYFSRIVF